MYTHTHTHTQGYDAYTAETVPGHCNPTNFHVCTLATSL